MIPTKIWAGMAILALVACKDKAPQTPKLSQVLPNLPLPPNASVVSKSGSSDALQITLISPVKAQEVEMYYRTVLSKSGWRLVNDMRDRDGAVVLLAEQNGPPLWVRIKSTDDSAATMVELAGAVVTDTTKRVKPAKPAT
jgi:hypothetical protein